MFNLKLRGRGSVLEKAKIMFDSSRKRLPAKKVLKFVDGKPFTSFFIALGVLLLLIVSGNTIANFTKKEEVKPVVVKNVQAYRIGSSPKVSLQGQIEKSGVYRIVAQTAGIVSSINLNEGDKVGKGQSIVSLSSSYQGGNIPALQASLANKQYKNILDTYETQKSIIGDQKSIATLSASNSDKLRDISKQNLDDTNSLINLNQDILNTLSSQLTVLESTNVGGSNNADILQTKQLISQLQSGLSQLRASSRGLGLQADSASPPSQISEISKNMMIKQLDVQLKALDINREVSRIQSAIAGVSASFMSPAAPSSGKIERIYVKQGDSVGPGTLLALVSGNKQESNVIIRVPSDIALRISQTEPSTIYIDGKSYESEPSYISGEATDGQLYSIIYPISVENQAQLTDGSYIKVEVPVETPDTFASIPFIPLDAVYQTQNEAYILIISEGKAVGRKVMLGTVYGRFVQVLSGLKDKDQVILNRNIIAGDSIKVQ